MQPEFRLREDCRTNRRTVADAREVIREQLGSDYTGAAHFRITPFNLPSGEWTALVDIVFPELGYCVSLPSSSRFKARRETSQSREEFEILRLAGAEICPDGSVRLAESLHLRAVEVIPTVLPYELSKTEERILAHVIVSTKRFHCFRWVRDDLPPHLRDQVPDLCALDYSRLHTIPPRLLKQITAHIKEHDPDFAASPQKIADTLAKCGIRVPVRRPRSTKLPQSNLERHC